MDWKLDVNIISGGQVRCGRWWTMEAAAIDLCFKVYCVTGGGARMRFGDEVSELTAGNIYLVNGFKLSRQWCDDYMDVSWVHFIPEGINPRVLASLLPAISSWPIGQAEGFSEAASDIYRDKKSGLAPLAADCRLLGVVNLLLAGLLEGCSESEFHKWSASFGRVKAAMDYMDTHYTENPQLETVAGFANLTPNYFHRAFKDILGLTPYEYMLKKRLNKAKHLLTTTDMQISEIAVLTGYENSYYFSRTFRKHTGKTPSQVRKNSPV